MSLVRRAKPAPRQTTAKHRNTPARTRAATAAAPATGNLVVTLVSASIKAPDLTGALPPAPGHRFTVTVTSAIKGARKIPPSVTDGQAPVVITLPAGTYRIDVAEVPTKDVNQAYPAGQCLVVIQSPKTTKATVVLANDGLRDVGDLCDFRLGMQVRPYVDLIGEAQARIVQTEFNVTEFGIFWESMQSSAPPTDALTAPLFRDPKLAKLSDLRGKLATYGWSTPGVPTTPGVTPPPVFSDRCWNGMNFSSPGKRFEVMPTPVAWINFGQTPAWYSPAYWKIQSAERKPPTPKHKKKPAWKGQYAPPLPAHYNAGIGAYNTALGADVAPYRALKGTNKPGKHFNPDDFKIPAPTDASVGPTWSALLFDHVESVMRYTRRLQTANDAYPWIAGPTYAWVAVNEAFDSSNAEALMFWSGLSSVPKDAEVNKLRVELVAKLLKHAGAVDAAGILLVNDFLIEFQPPRIAKKNGKAPRLSGAGQLLQSKYAKSNTFRAMMKPVLDGAGALRKRIGVGYQLHFPYAKEYLAKNSPFPAAFDAGVNAWTNQGVPIVITEMVVQAKVPDDVGSYNAGFYSQHDQASSVWQDQARVYRDIIGRFLANHHCNAVCFWGLFDEPNDETGDHFGHLYDAGQWDEAAGTYTTRRSATVTDAPPGWPYRKPAYFGVLNGLIDAVHSRKPSLVPNWRRMFVA